MYGKGSRNETIGFVCVCVCECVCVCVCLCVLEYTVVNTTVLMYSSIM